MSSDFEKQRVRIMLRRCWLSLGIIERVTISFSAQVIEVHVSDNPVLAGIIAAKR